MKNLDFKYLAARNFLCYGPEGIELNLTKYRNIVLVRGNNLDVDSEEERVASNGVGKSSIPEIIVYTLFGKTVKHPKKLTHLNVINNKIGRNLRTEVRWGNYRVVRKRKPEELQLWETKDGNWDEVLRLEALQEQNLLTDEDKKKLKEYELTLGGMPATQKLIEDKLGLNYDTFVNVVIFTDNNSGSFLECDAPTKRTIVENLLSLDKYRTFSETAKKLRKKRSDKIKEIAKEYDLLLAQLQQCEQRIQHALQQETNWKTQKKNELLQLVTKAKKIKENLESTDEGSALVKYKEAQSRLVEISEKIPSLEEKKAKLDEVLKTAQDKLAAGRDRKHQLTVAIREADSAISKFKTEIAGWERKINELESNKNTNCDHCFGTVSEANYGPYVMQLRNKISHNLGEITKQQRTRDSEQEKADTNTANVAKLTDAISAANEKLNGTTDLLGKLRIETNQLNAIEKPQSNIDVVVLEKEFESVRQQIFNKEEEIKGNSPFVEILVSARAETDAKNLECVGKKQEIANSEKELPYYDFWVTAFGDAGIRKFVIDGIIPALNSRVAYWLQYLIDGKIKLEFDNQLEESIERNPSDGDPFVYYAMSGGERRRINLAVSQAFAHVMLLNSGVCPSLVFLDEVTTNIDPIGVVGVYNMISELAKERQVFVTTHDQGLLEMLEGCESVVLEKKNGFTKLVKS